MNFISVDNGKISLGKQLFLDDSVFKVKLFLDIAEYETFGSIDAFFLAENVGTVALRKQMRKRFSRTGHKTFII